MFLTLLTLIAIFLIDSTLGKAFNSQSNNKDNSQFIRPMTLETPSGDYKHETSLKMILFNEYVSNAAPIDHNLSHW